ncbi:MAG: hypothetical protein K6G42_09690 [Lachnospiraceae bacterium]|nr:hypothetical protein [Lachnospiraceae bacterium]
MGKTEQKDKTLRRVNINASPVQAVAESMDTISSAFSTMTEMAPQTTVASPIMKKLNGLPAVIPQGNPSEQEVLKAHDEVGLKLSANSKKHPRRVTRAAEKRTLQRNVEAKRNAMAAFQKDPSVDAYGMMEALGIEKLMFDKSGKTSYEKLEKNYEAIRKTLAYLPDYEAAITQRKGNPNLTDAEKDALVKSEAKLKALYDIRAYYDVFERLMLNRYYVMLPHKEMHALSYKELRIRLQKLYLEPRRNEQLIDYYQNLIRLREIGLTDGKSASARIDEYYSDLKGEQPAQEERDPEEEMKKMMKAYQEMKSYLGKGNRLTTPDTAAAYRNMLFRTFEADIICFRSSISNPKGDMGEFLRDYDKYVTQRNSALSSARAEEQTRLQAELQAATQAGDQEAIRAATEALNNATARATARAALEATLQAEIQSGDQTRIRAAYLALNREEPKEAIRDVAKDDLYRIMSGAHKPDDEALLERDDGNVSTGIKLSDEQLEGVRLIGAWIIRHAFTERKKHDSFAFNLLRTRPEQQLLIYYLVENNKQDSAMGIDFYSALNNYQPNLERFKENAGKWENISGALRASIAINGEIKKYGIIADAIKQSDEIIKQDTDQAVQPHRSPQDQRITVIQAMAQRGIMLKMLYRNAGLHEDMPPDMAEDPVLRKRMLDEYKQIGALAGRLNALNQQLGDGADPRPSYDSPQNLRADRDEVSADEKSNVLATADSGMSAVNEYVLGDALGGLQNVMGGTGGYTDFFRNTQVFGSISNGVYGLTAVLGFIGAALTSANIATTHGLTVADRTAQGLSVSGDFSNSISGVLTTVGGFMSVFSSSSSSASQSVQWLGNASEAVWNCASASDKVLVAGGAFAICAGVVKTVASGVQLGRALSSKSDISRSRETLATKDEKNLTADEKILKRFLDHQSNETTRQAGTAGVGVATGLLAVGAGVLMMSGFLAPIGAVVGLAALGIDLTFGKLLNRSRKKNNRKAAVDEFLRTDALMEKVLDEHPQKDRLRNMDKGKLRELVREEALSMVGFCSYDECYKHVCTQYATMLYENVFVKNTANPQEKKMYKDAMESLGMKIVEPKVQGDVGKPSVEAMVAKMMDS